MTGQRGQKVQRWAENVPGRDSPSDVDFFIKQKIYLQSSTECYSGRARSRGHQALGCPREE